MQKPTVEKIPMRERARENRELCCNWVFWLGILFWRTARGVWRWVGTLMPLKSPRHKRWASRVTKFTSHTPSDQWEASLPRQSKPRGSAHNDRWWQPELPFWWRNRKHGRPCGLFIVSVILGDLAARRYTTTKSREFRWCKHWIRNKNDTCCDFGY